MKKVIKSDKKVSDKSDLLKCSKALEIVIFSVHNI